MAGVLVVPFANRLRAGRPRAAGAAGSPRRLLLSPLALLPVAAFTLSRQSQVFIERYLGSALPPGTISHLNYATKVSQLAMATAILICTVTFPAGGPGAGGRRPGGGPRRVEKDLGRPPSWSCSAPRSCRLRPAVVESALRARCLHGRRQRGHRAVIQVYSLGLLGQMPGRCATVRPYFPAAGRRDPGTRSPRWSSACWSPPWWAGGDRPLGRARPGGRQRGGHHQHRRAAAAGPGRARHRRADAPGAGRPGPARSAAVCATAAGGRWRPGCRPRRPSIVAGGVAVPAVFAALPRRSAPARSRPARHRDTEGTSMVADLIAPAETAARAGRPGC